MRNYILSSTTIIQKHKIKPLKYTTNVLKNSCCDKKVITLPPIFSTLLHAILEGASYFDHCVLSTIGATLHGYSYHPFGKKKSNKIEP